MKYSILGFYQQAVLAITKDVIVEQKNGEYPKTKTLKLDCIDLLILQDVADFMNRKKIIKYTVDDKIYFSIQYSAIIDDLPILGIKQQALSDRLSKLVELELLEKVVIKNQAGSFIAFRLGEKYESIKYTLTESEIGTSSTLHSQKYSTTFAEVADYGPKYSSTNNSYTKKEKEDKSSFPKERLDYDEILAKWKEICPDLPQPRIINDDRKKAIRELLKKNNATIEDLYKAFQMISISSHCNAKTERNKTWKATLNWLINDTKGCFNRLLEGEFACTPSERELAEKIKRGEWKKEDSIKATYHPFGNNNIMWNDIYKCWLSIDYFDGSVIDGYNDDNRPDGAEIVLHNGRGTITWSKKDKKWNIEMKSPWK